MLPGKEWGISMSVLREIVVAVAGVYALLFACDAVFGVGEARFDDAYYSASFYAPRPKEFRFAGDTPYQWRSAYLAQSASRPCARARLS